MPLSYTSSCATETSSDSVSDWRFRRADLDAWTGAQQIKVVSEEDAAGEMKPHEAAYQEETPAAS